jgi:long-chain acyl-CoA synthetase
MGVTPGDTVLLQGIEGADWIEAFFGVLRVGGIVVPLSPDASPGFRQKVATEAAVKWLIGATELEPPYDIALIVIGSWHGRRPALLPQIDPTPDDRAEIIFTSGTTGDPKGVILTHGNLIADFAPIERVFQRYRRIARIASGSRVLVSVPLSHMFGQAVAIFLLPILGFGVVLTPPRPLDVIAAARLMKAWGLITTPRVLDLLAQRVCHELRIHARPSGRYPAGEALHKWSSRSRAFPAWRVRHLFGWRFMLVVSGGAPLPSDLQAFWRRLGFLVSQGYGLTETAPIVSVSNPFRGETHVGRPMSNQELKIGNNGEVFVRGKNVTPGYLGGIDSEKLVDGWFRTGDIGELDKRGQLTIKGRASELIVTADGENVHSSDVEDVLRRIAGVRDVCVVGVPGRVGEEVHAALLLARDDGEAFVVEQANHILQPKQRIRSHTLWPEIDFPRTTTGKVQTSLVRSKIVERRRRGGPDTERTTSADPFQSVVARFAGVDPNSFDDATTLGEGLGFGSLDIIELTTCIEEDLGILLDEELFDDWTVGDLRARIDAAGSFPGMPARNASAWKSSLRMPRWAVRFPAQQIRRLIDEAVLVPLVEFYSRPSVSGRHHLDAARRPLLLVSNHRSHVDAGLLKACVPRKLRARLAPGMTTRWERAFFGEETGTFGRFLAEWVEARLLQLLFNAWPIPRTAGFRQSILYAGELADSGFSLLLFPEGRHVPAGVMSHFRPGTGMLARELRLPIVPVYLEGTEQIIPEGEPWYRFHFGGARVTFGEPFEVDPAATAVEITRRIQDAVRALAPPGLKIVELPPEEWMDGTSEN